MPRSWKPIVALSIFVVGCAGKAASGGACSGAGVLCTVAGTVGKAGVDGDGGPAKDSRLYWPQDITAAADGTLFIADFNNHRVRKIDLDGMISTFIGTGALGDGTNGTATQIDLNHPTGLTIGPDGNYYLAAWHNWKIKEISAANEVVSKFAGTLQGNIGDEGPAGSAKMNLPSSIVFDGTGNAFVSDEGNERIRKIDAAGVIHNLAGSTKGYAEGIGAAAQFAFPTGPDAIPGGKIALSNDKTTLYVADTENHRIRTVEIATGTVATLAGTGAAGYSGDNGPAAAATLNMPTDIAVAADGSIFIADSQNHVVRKIDATGKIHTVAGTGIAGSSPNGTLAKNAKLNTPSGVEVAVDGTLYIADTDNHVVERIENP